VLPEHVATLGVAAAVLLQFIPWSFGWWKTLPWNDVRFFAPFMGMLIFIPAGAGGVVNASNQMNAAVHNTLFITGHFHLTVATSVALTFFGITYWLVPAATGRVLTPRINKLGVVQTWIWVVGRAIMSGAMYIVGFVAVLLMITTSSCCCARRAGLRNTRSRRKPNRRTRPACRPSSSAGASGSAYSRR